MTIITSSEPKQVKSHPRSKGLEASKTNHVAGRAVGRAKVAPYLSSGQSQEDVIYPSFNLPAARQNTSSSQSLAKLSGPLTAATLHHTAQNALQVQVAALLAQLKLTTAEDLKVSKKTPPKAAQATLSKKMDEMKFGCEILLQLYQKNPNNRLLQGAMSFACVLISFTADCMDNLIKQTGSAEQTSHNLTLLQSSTVKSESVYALALKDFQELFEKFQTIMQEIDGAKAFKEMQSAVNQAQKSVDKTLGYTWLIDVGIGAIALIVSILCPPLAGVMAVMAYGALASGVVAGVSAGASEIEIDHMNDELSGLKIKLASALASGQLAVLNDFTHMLGNDAEDFTKVMDVITLVTAVASALVNAELMLSTGSLSTWLLRGAFFFIDVMPSLGSILSSIANLAAAYQSNPNSKDAHWLGKVASDIATYDTIGGIIANTCISDKTSTKRAVRMVLAMIINLVLSIVLMKYMISDKEQSQPGATSIKDIQALEQKMLKLQAGMSILQGLGSLTQAECNVYSAYVTVINQAVTNFTSRLSMYMKEQTSNLEMHNNILGNDLSSTNQSIGSYNQIIGSLSNNFFNAISSEEKIIMDMLSELGSL